MGIPPGVRQNLGRWMTIASTETYTRDHRTAITNAWEQTIKLMKEGNLPSLDPGRLVPPQPFQALAEERRDTLARPGTRTPIHRLPEAAPGTSTSSSSTAAAVTSVPHAAVDADTLALTPRLILNAASKHLHWSTDYQVATGQGSCIGCGWQFHRQQIFIVTAENQVYRNWHQCTWAFNKMNFPAT